MLTVANVDLPLIWYGLIATAIFLYVLLDGFDLGVGVLFPFAPSDQCRDRMMNSIAPFWDGNETWLVLGGGGLLAAFPLAYAVFVPAVYMPVILMLLGLILRGVAFEFRFKAEPDKRKLWDLCFHFGSLVAAFFQGIILGAFIQGVKVDGRQFAGGTMDWLTPFTVLVGLALILGYALLGATWLVMKTENVTQAWARGKTKLLFLGVLGSMGLVTILTPIIVPGVKELWFTMPNLLFLLPMPLITAGLFFLLWRDLQNEAEYRPFFLTVGIFLMNYIGLGATIWPYLVPFEITFRQAAAAPASQTLLLVGIVFFLPLVLLYTGFCYWVFRGKVSHEPMY